MRQLIIICLLASLAGCVSRERRDITAYSEAVCQKEGYAPDSAEYRGCVATKVNSALPESGSAGPIPAKHNRTCQQLGRTIQCY